MNWSSTVQNYEVYPSELTPKAVLKLSHIWDWETYGSIGASVRPSPRRKREQQERSFKFLAPLFIKPQQSTDRSPSTCSTSRTNTLVQGRYIQLPFCQMLYIACGRDLPCSPGGICCHGECNPTEVHHSHYCFLSVSSCFALLFF